MKLQPSHKAWFLQGFFTFKTASQLFDEEEVKNPSPVVNSD